MIRLQIPILTSSFMWPFSGISTDCSLILWHKRPREQSTVGFVVGGLLYCSFLSSSGFDMGCGAEPRRRLNRARAGHIIVMQWVQDLQQQPITLDDLCQYKHLLQDSHTTLQVRSTTLHWSLRYKPPQKSDQSHFKGLFVVGLNQIDRHKDAP